MCSNPITANNVTFACRKCNDCLTTRKNGWVARAMAEKATSAHTYSVTLTYGSDTQEKRDGAAAFRYSDVYYFLKRLRDRAKYKFGKEAYVRFLCAGELGSQNGRCHWHIVLYSNFDIASLGSFKNFHTKKSRHRIRRQNLSR